MSGRGTTWARCFWSLFLPGGLCSPAGAGATAHGWRPASVSTVERRPIQRVAAAPGGWASLGGSCDEAGKCRQDLSRLVLPQNRSHAGLPRPHSNPAAGLASGLRSLSSAPRNSAGLKQLYSAAPIPEPRPHLPEPRLRKSGAGTKVWVSSCRLRPDALAFAEPGPVRSRAFAEPRLRGVGPRLRGQEPHCKAA